MSGLSGSPDMMSALSDRWLHQKLVLVHYALERQPMCSGALDVCRSDSHNSEKGLRTTEPASAKPEAHGPMDHESSPCTTSAS